MGVASSTTTPPPIVATPSSSTAPINLNDLPQIPTPKVQGDDPVWEDLKHLETVLRDPERQHIESALTQTWTSLMQWLREQGDTVHRQQSEIHTELEDVARLTTELKELQKMERMKCERLQTAMIEASRLKEVAVIMETRVKQLEDRLRSV